MKHRSPAAWPAPQGFTSREEQMKATKKSMNTWDLYESEDDFDREFSEMRKIEMMWFKIHTAAQTNPGLQELLDRAIMYYRLLEEKDNGGNDGG